MKWKLTTQERKFPFGSAWARHLIMRKLLRLRILICLYFTNKQPSVKRMCVQIFLVTNEPTINYNYPINSDCCFSCMGLTLPNITRNAISLTHQKHKYACQLRAIVWAPSIHATGINQVDTRQMWWWLWEDGNNPSIQTLQTLDVFCPMNSL